MAAAISKEQGSNNKGHLVIAAVVVSVILLNLAVLVRIISRRILKLPLMADDYMIFLAAVTWPLVLTCVRAMCPDTRRYL